jgi:hypothetical protein
MKRIFLAAWVVGLSIAGCIPKKPAQGAGGEPVTQGGGEGKSLQIATDPDRPSDSDEWGIIGDPSYSSVVDKVVHMVDDPAVMQGAQRRGLNVLNVMWEDTGRAQNSSIGPNITDLTLQVRYRRSRDEQEETALMPVIRFPNFTDRTGDVPASKLFIRVGNQRDKKNLKTVALTDVLRNLRGFASKPWAIGGNGNLLSPRDTHFLVSAQAVFLPIPKAGKAEFNPVVFNYQSAPGSPAVLTLLVTRQGTSITVIENSPEDATVQGRGQELYFNDEGQRAAFTAERRTDVKERIEAQGGPKTQDDRTALQKGADVLMLVQVPLRHRDRGMLPGGGGAPPAPAPTMGYGGAAKASAPAPMAAAESEAAAPAEKSDVEQAVLGHGKRRGPFTEGNGVVLERDPQFPIRVTMQFYKATSNGVADERDLDAIARTIGSVYEHADYVGSLVVPEGDPARPTEWQRIPSDWFRW